MAKITDYRTESQKRREAMYKKIYARYLELREEGLAKTRACDIAAQENEWTTSGTFRLVSRIEAQQAD